MGESCMVSHTHGWAQHSPQPMSRHSAQPMSQHSAQHTAQHSAWHAAEKSLRNYFEMAQRCGVVLTTACESDSRTQSQHGGGDRLDVA